MATPPFILELRSKIGHAPLWIPGCTAVVLRPAASSSLTRVTGASVDLADIEVLMVKRADNGKWTPETGPADGENTEAAFFPANDLPPTNERFRTAIKRALSGEDGPAVFNR